MADRDPGRVSAEVDWREVARLVLTSREMDRHRGRGARSGQEGALSILGARPRHGAGAAGASAQGWRRSVRLLPLTAVAAGARSAARRCARFGDGAGRRLFRRARYRRRVQLPESRRRARTADVRRSGGAIYAIGRMGAGDRLQAEGAGRRPVRCHCFGARRRRELRHGRILVCVNNCNDAIFAAADLHRGQWLRDLGSIGISDTWQGHRGQFGELPRPDDFRRRRH